MLDTSECGPLKIHREGVMALTAAEERGVKRAHAQKFTITSETFLLPFFFFFKRKSSDDESERLEQVASPVLKLMISFADDCDAG